MRIILALIGGGIGNLIFQINAAYVLAKNCEADYYIVSNFGDGGRPNVREYIDLFKHVTFITREEMHRMNAEDQKNGLTIATYEDLDMWFSSFPDHVHEYDTVVIQGYFQSYKYVDSYKFTDHNRQLLLRNVASSVVEARRKVVAVAEGNITTCVHVRRGDYLNKPFYYNVLPEEYYRLAMKEGSGCKYLVFSENPEDIKHWAVWKSHDVHFVEEPSPLLSLLMMSLCDNHIIANSTMSLCGYLLSERKGGLVYPTQWFGREGPVHRLEDIVPVNDPGARSVTVPSSLKSFLINLKSRPDRLQAFFKNYPGMISDIEVVPGFYGKNPEGEHDKHLFDAMTDSLAPGEKGCFLSHIRVMQKIVDGGYKRAIVMEDDLTFTDDYVRRLQIVLDELPPSADFAFIGGRFTKDFLMPEEFAIPHSEHVVITKFCGPQFTGWNKENQNRTSQCYMISARGAQLFLDFFKMNPEQLFPYDFWYFLVAQQCNMTMYNANPLLCHSALVGDSDIR